MFVIGARILYLFCEVLVRALRCEIGSVLRSLQVANRLYGVEQKKSLSAVLL
jgi:hypothetical protein